MDQFKVFELDENTKSIVDDVQKVYAAQVFDAFTVKVSFISQEISKIEQTQSQHQASDLQLDVPTRVKNDCLFLSEKYLLACWFSGYN